MSITIKKACMNVSENMSNLTWVGHTRDRERPSLKPRMLTAPTSCRNVRASPAQTIARSSTIVAIKMVGLLPMPIDSGTHRKHPRPMNKFGAVTIAFKSHGLIFCGDQISRRRCRYSEWFILHVGNRSGYPQEQHLQPGQRSSTPQSTTTTQTKHRRSSNDSSSRDRPYCRMRQEASTSCQCW